MRITRLSLFILILVIDLTKPIYATNSPDIELLTLHSAFEQLAQEAGWLQLQSKVHAIMPPEQHITDFADKKTAESLFMLLKQDLPQILDLTIHSFSSPFGPIDNCYTYMPAKEGRLFVYDPSHTIPPFSTNILDLVKEYKIHLMPFKNDIPEILYVFLKEVSSNQIFRKNIADFKFNIMQPHQKPPYFPTIVIYPKASKTSAQEVLNTIYRLFKDYQGTGLPPRWNQKVTNLIWWAQGNGDVKKKTDMRNNMFVPGDDQGNGAVVFKENITGRYEDYWLKDPATLH